MKKLLMISLFTASFNLVASDVTPYIVNGTVANVSDFPSTAPLFYDSSNIDGRYYSDNYCGSTVLDAYHVLTAAHCVYNSDAARLFTIVSPKLQSDATYNPNTSPRYRVSAVYFRSDYDDRDSELLPNDIAILKVETPMSGVTGVKFETNQSLYRKSTEKFVTVGHGSIFTNVTYRGDLRKADLEYVDNNTCKTAYTDGHKLNDAHLCFKGTPHYSSAICGGDSGGAVYWDKAGDGSDLYQVGISSFGPSTCGANSVASSVFTEVADYTSWITSVLSGSVSPTYTASDSERSAHISTYGGISLTATVPVPSSGGGGGGQFPIWLSLLLLPLGVKRKNRLKK